MASVKMTEGEARRILGDRYPPPTDRGRHIPEPEPFKADIGWYQPFIDQLEEQQRIDRLKHRAALQREVRTAKRAERAARPWWKRLFNTD